MVHHLEHLDDEGLKAIRAATFPAYRGRSVCVVAAESLTLHNTQWSGGSRTQYVLISLRPIKAMPIPSAPFLQHSQMHETPQEIRPGFAIVSHSYFCGKDGGLTIYLHPSEMPKRLKAETDVTDDERIVLYATRSLKSSYAGVKNYRFHEARQNTGITSERWDTAKGALIGRKLLNKAGAITPAGRNASGESFTWPRQAITVE